MFKKGMNSKDLNTTVASLTEKSLSHKKKIIQSDPLILRNCCNCGPGHINCTLTTLLKAESNHGTKSDDKHNESIEKWFGL